MRCYAHLGDRQLPRRAPPGSTPTWGSSRATRCSPATSSSCSSTLTGHSRKHDYREASRRAHVRCVPRFLELIEREIEQPGEGRPARIVAKMNQLEDPQIIRGFGESLPGGRPGRPDRPRASPASGPASRACTENMRVISIIGRFLEHSRIFHFANGAEDPLDGDFLIGSADWMHRNLSDAGGGDRPDRAAPPEGAALGDPPGLPRRPPPGLGHAARRYLYAAPPCLPDATGPALEGTHATLMARTLARSQAGRV